MQCLLDVFLAKISLTIVKQNSASPVEEHSTIHELLLNVVRKLDDFTQIVCVVQNCRLDPHLNVSD